MHCSIDRKNRRRAWSRCRKCGRGFRTSTCVASSICFGMVQILGFSGNSTDRPHASTVEVLSVVGPMAGSGTLVAVKAQYV